MTLSSFFLTVNIIYVVLTGCLPYPARIIKVSMKITHTNYLEKKNEREREKDTEPKTSRIKKSKSL